MGNNNILIKIFPHKLDFSKLNKIITLISSNNSLLIQKHLALSHKYILFSYQLHKINHHKLIFHRFKCLNLRLCKNLNKYSH